MPAQIPAALSLRPVFFWLGKGLTFDIILFRTACQCPRLEFPTNFAGADSIQQNMSSVF